MEKDLIRLVAELISGLHVPRSLKQMGAAGPAYDAIRKKIGDWGWSSAEDIEELLRKKHKVAKGW